MVHSVQLWIIHAKPSVHHGPHRPNPTGFIDNGRIDVGGVTLYDGVQR